MRGHPTSFPLDLFGELTCKRCTCCKRVLSVEHFSTNGYSPAGRRYFAGRCRKCMAKKARAWGRKHRTTRVRDRNLIASYGITLAEYSAMLASQGGACAICGDVNMPIDPRTKEPYQLAVDHCHATGTIRALLCPACNNGLGCFKDDPARLHAAVSYLARFA